MTPLLHPFLVNDRFGDPALYVDFKFESRALLFDLGDLHGLEARKILRLSDIFVSHTHIDHFIGFDQVLRTLYGRDGRVRLFGPAGFIERLTHRLGGYTWNLVERSATDLVFVATEVVSAQEARRAVLRARRRFAPEATVPLRLIDGIVLDDTAFTVRATVLDHRIPCLAFAVEEKAHVNIWKSRLEEMGLAVGPWLRELKRAVLGGAPDATEVRVAWRGDNERHGLTLSLGELRRRVVRIVPGQKIVYVVDALYSADNARRIVALAAGADVLFIEAAFAEADVARAADRYHLTTAQAGALARQAGVRRLAPFHFSPRYRGREAELLREVAASFGRPLAPAPSDRPARAEHAGGAPQPALHRTEVAIGGRRELTDRPAEQGRGDPKPS